MSFIDLFSYLFSLYHLFEVIPTTLYQSLSWSAGMFNSRYGNMSFLKIMKFFKVFLRLLLLKFQKIKFIIFKSLDSNLNSKIDA
jgi:hypothetical protein